MNLYKLHANPESLKQGFHDTVPSLFWEKYKNKPDELKKRESYIAKDPKYAYKYALVLKGLKGRHRFSWEPGEAAIATSSKFSCLYARNVLHRRFLLGEKSIADSSHDSVDYAYFVIKGRWEMGEDAIAKDADESFAYADFLNKPFPKGEAIMAKDPHIACNYAIRILKGRFSLGEEAISKNSVIAKKYSDFLDQDTHPIRTVYDAARDLYDE